MRLLRVEHIWGTAITLDIRDAPEAATADDVFAWFRRVDSLFSTWRADSEISRLGRDLYKRLSDMGSHWLKLGRSLDNAVDAYNRAVGSLEARVMVSARRFVDLDAGAFGVDVEELAPIDKATRVLQTPELLGDEPSASRQ